MSNRCLQRLAVVIVLGTTLLSGPASAERIAATYCVTIDVNLEQTDALTSRFDDFAGNTGLTFETGDPGGRYYYNMDETAMFALRNGMGEFGSILSYVPLNKEVSTELPELLAQFVAKQIAPNYEVIRCEEIEGFSMPALYR